MLSVYDDPAYADTRAELHAELKRLRDEFAVGDDPVPMPEDPTQHVPVTPKTPR